MNISSRFFSSALVLLGLFVSLARADEAPVTVFVDLNDSPYEIEATRKNTSGEVIVIPTTDGKPRTKEQNDELKQLADINAELRKLETKEKQAKDHATYLSIYLADSTLREHLESSRKHVRGELKISFGHFPFTEAEIKAQIVETMSAHKTSRLVFSGEHFENHFFGEMGVLSEDSIAETVLNHPQNFESVKSVYGLGCYTGVKNVLHLWHDLMPNLNQILGYDGRAPSGSNSAGIQVLSTILSKENQLILASNNTKDHNALERATREALKMTDTSAVVCTCNTCVGKKIGTFSLLDNDDDKKGCTLDGYNHVDEIMGDFLLVLPNATSPDNNDYCDTSHSRIRSLYNDIESYQQCGKEAKDPKLRIGFRGHAKDFYRLGAAVFFQNVTSNFAQYNQADLAALKTIAKNHRGFPMLDLKKPMSCIGITSPDSNLNRKTVVQWINTLGQSVDGLSDEEKNCVNKMKARMTSQLTLLECIPPTWVHEPTDDEVETPPPAQECNDSTGRACDF
jgi:hypothetical protein